jgi:hypothetical protein
VTIPVGESPPEQATHPAPATGDRFRLLVESLVDYGIFMLDVRGFVSSWNTGAQRMEGYAAHEVIGRHFSIFYTPEEVANGKCERDLESATREGRFEEEGWRVRKDGSLFWASVVITPIRDESGTHIGFGKVTRDLTERMLAQADMKRSEERLRLLIAAVKDYAIFILDPTGHISTWNPGAERLKGYSPQEIIGRHFSTFYSEEDVRSGKCEMELEQAQRVGRFEDEGWRIRKDGTQFWANVIITPIYDPSGALLGFAKVTRDLSERKAREAAKVELARAEEARRIAEENQGRALAIAENLRRARDSAEEAARLKDDFLATVSHELRTPLNAILGWSRMLHAGTVRPEKVQHALDAIVRNATSQSQIIDDLLDMSRIIAGKLRLDVEIVDINEIAAAAIDVVRPSADIKGIDIRFLADPEAGPIQADAGRLQQVLWNLLSNAVKFTPKGGRVDVTVRRLDSQLEIQVADTGQGIAPAFLPHVFDRFSQEESSNARRAGGLGLGLAIVKHLVDLHAGSVTVRSDGEGRGTSFVIRLPLMSTRSSYVERGVTPAAVDDLVFPVELHGLSVVVLDDERDARELIQMVLERGGAHVTTVSSVAEALASVANHKPSVIISDIGMPDEDGYAFIRRLRELPSDQGGRIPAIALTAYARAEDRRKALSAGFQNHAAKPIEPQELVLVVANLAGRYC